MKFIPCTTLLRKVSQDILTATGAVNLTIKYTTKSHYGGPELMYVTSEHKEPLSTLTNSKTLSSRHVKALETLGFKFQSE